MRLRARAPAGQAARAGVAEGGAGVAASMSVTVEGSTVRVVLFIGGIMSLPLMSSGGAAMVTLGMAMGGLVSICRRSQLVQS